ncbi:MAG TPA: hypothetical protein G4N98_07845 [Thermoflexia bacterium]|nr:hypothetical protein [Thermoflexia bacterium]
MNQFRKYDPLGPDNREAAESLQRLARPSPPLETASSTVQGNGLRCPQCGGTMEVHFIGELRDKRARCPYRGTEVDLPDSYQAWWIRHSGVVYWRVPSAQTRICSWPGARYA